MCSCSVFNNLKPPSTFPSPTDFHLFKEEIEPKWEDPVCKGGGAWTATVATGIDLDQFWLEGVLGFLF